MVPRFRGIQLSPGAREKENRKDPPCPYPEPTQVPLGEEPKAYQATPSKGNRQISLVPLEEGVPGILS
jgi:hypothetical protein